MEEFPIIPEKTAMLFFDTLNIYLHPENPAPETAAAISKQIAAMQKIEKACREAGIAHLLRAGGPPAGRQGLLAARRRPGVRRQAG